MVTELPYALSYDLALEISSDTIESTTHRCSRGYFVCGGRLSIKYIWLDGQTFFLLFWILDWFPKRIIKNPEGHDRPGDREEGRNGRIMGDRRRSSDRYLGWKDTIEGAREATLELVVEGRPCPHPLLLHGGKERPGYITEVDKKS